MRKKAELRRDRRSEGKGEGVDVRSAGEETGDEYREGQEVDLMICGQTEIGYKAVINNSGVGMLYKNEVFQKLARGQHVQGFIRKVREDGKIDLSLHRPGHERIEGVSEKIVAELKAAGGFIPLTDTSPPEMIYGMFGVSKKTFKKAIGALYRKRLILIEQNGIRLVSDGRKV